MRTSIIAIFIALQGCAVDPEPSSEAQQGEARSTLNQADVAPSAGLAFVHGPSRSQFDVGAAPRVEGDGTFERLVGSRGAFFMDKVTGATLAVESSTDNLTSKLALALKAGVTFALPRPLTSNPDEHNATARQYFGAVGIPEGEVAGMHVTTTMAGTNALQAPGRAQSTFLWYTSHMERAVSGIPVEGSFAYVAFDSSHGIIEEGVYWPAIPKDVVAEAVALRQKLTEPGNRAIFLASRRAEEPSIDDAAGEVRIVHTAAGFHGAFEAQAAFTTTTKGPGKRRVLRYSGQGSPVTLADDVVLTTEKIQSKP